MLLALFAPFARSSQPLLATILTGPASWGAPSFPPVWHHAIYMNLPIIVSLAVSTLVPLPPIAGIQHTCRACPLDGMAVPRHDDGSTSRFVISHIVSHTENERDTRSSTIPSDRSMIPSSQQPAGHPFASSRLSSFLQDASSAIP